MKPKSTPLVATNSAINSLKSETDRGAAVLAGSMVENALGQFLERHCRVHVKAKDIERLFGSTGPISTFSQRTLVAAAFGLLDSDDCEQLNIVRDIRNHFAHHPMHASFEDVDILGKTKRLRFHDLAVIEPVLRETGSSRMAYLLTCGWLLGALQGSQDGSNDSTK
jgi:DNA-binding MltR family transcriptional regulator